MRTLNACIVVVAALHASVVAQSAIQVPLDNLTYSGSWHQRTGDCGLEYYSNGTGATVSYTFNGTTFTFSIPSFDNSGLTKYQVDGGDWTSKRFNATSTICDDTGFSEEGLAPTNHTVTVLQGSKGGLITAITGFSYTPSDAIVTSTTTTVASGASETATDSPAALDSTHSSKAKTIALAVAIPLGLLLVCGLAFGLLRWKRGSFQRLKPLEKIVPASSYTNDSEYDQEPKSAVPFVGRNSGTYSPTPSSGRPWSPHYTRRPVSTPLSLTGIALEPMEDDRNRATPSRTSIAASADSVSIYSHERGEAENKRSQDS